MGASLGASLGVGLSLWESRNERLSLVELQASLSFVVGNSAPTAESKPAENRFALWGNALSGDIDWVAFGMHPAAALQVRLKKTLANSRT